MFDRRSLLSKAFGGVAVGLTAGALRGQDAATLPECDALPRYAPRPEFADYVTGINATCCQLMDGEGEIYHRYVFSFDPSRNPMRAGVKVLLDGREVADLYGTLTHGTTDFMKSPGSGVLSFVAYDVSGRCNSKGTIVKADMVKPFILG